MRTALQFIEDHLEWLNNPDKKIEERPKGKDYDLQGANLNEVDLEWADLEGANLKWANLYKANLKWANLSEADLELTNLSEANLKWANLYGANIKWANLYKANIDLIERNIEVMSPYLIRKIIELKGKEWIKEQFGEDE